MIFNSIQDRRIFYAKNYHSEFSDGFWNCVNMGYVPSYDTPEQLIAYMQEYRFAKEGNTHADLQNLFTEIVENVLT